MSLTLGPWIKSACDLEKRLLPVGLFCSSSTITVYQDTALVRVIAEFNVKGKQITQQNSTQGYLLKIGDTSPNVCQNFRQQSSIPVLNKYHACATEKKHCGCVVPVPLRVVL